MQKMSHIGIDVTFDLRVNKIHVTFQCTKRVLFGQIQTFNKQFTSDNILVQYGGTYFYAGKKGISIQKMFKGFLSRRFFLS